MKRFFAFVLVLLFSFAFIMGCGKKEAKEEMKQEQVQEQVQEEAVDTTAVDTTAAMEEME